MLGDSRNEVVAFETCFFPPHNSENIEQFSNHSQLLNQNFRRFVTLGLVLRNRIMAESRLGPIKHHYNAVWLVVSHQGQQHRGEAVHSVCHLAACISHIFGQRIKGSIRQRVAIKRHDQHGIDFITIRDAIRQRSPCRLLPS